jgi:hypothetical protein
MAASESQSRDPSTTLCSLPLPRLRNCCNCPPHFPVSLLWHSTPVAASGEFGHEVEVRLGDTPWELDISTAVARGMSDFLL